MAELIEVDPAQAIGYCVPEHPDEPITHTRPFRSGWYAEHLVDDWDAFWCRFIPHGETITVIAKDGER